MLGRGGCHALYFFCASHGNLRFLFTEGIDRLIVVGIYIFDIHKYANDC